MNTAALRKRYYNVLKPRLEIVEILRGETDENGEISDEYKTVCKVYGYHYSKYLQIVRTVVSGGDLSKESNERMLILPIDENGEPYGDYPEILAGDRYDFDGRRYRVNYVQDNAGVTRTQISEREYGHV